MKKIKANNGITLIALVITIIVMLILAGVSLSLVVGENGILTKAQGAVLKNKAGIAQEEIETAFAAIQANYYSSGSSLYETVSATETGGVYYTSNKVYYYSPEQGAYTATMSENGIGEVVEITDTTSIDYETAVQAYNAAHPEKHIPKGFEYLTGSVLDGYVIKGNTENANGSEFVWIPVPSKAYYKKQIGTRNYSMKDNSGWQVNSDPENPVVTIENGVKGDYIGVGTILDKSFTDATTGDQPEKEVIYEAGGFWVGRYEASVNNNGQLANPNTPAVADIKVQEGLQPIRGITQTDSMNLSNTWYSATAGEDEEVVSVQSGLITGTQWDMMCKYIGWDVCDRDCGSWGNYYNIGSTAYSGFRGNGNNFSWADTFGTKAANSYAVFPSGKFVNANGGNTAKKNIFDVAGNVWEWTTEIPTNGFNASHDSAHAVHRGGSTYYNSSYGFATGRYGSYSVGAHSWDFGFRLVLYVK